MNRVLGVATKGILKGQALEIHIGETSKDCKIFAGGKEISCSVKAFYIKCVGGERTRITLEMIQR